MAKGGQLTLNHVSDADLIMILGEKEKEKTLGFSPQTLRPAVNPSGQAVPNTYDNCTLTWNDNGGLKAVSVIVHKLLYGHDKQPA